MQELRSSDRSFKTYKRGRKSGSTSRAVPLSSPARTWASYVDDSAAVSIPSTRHKRARTRSGSRAQHPDDVIEGDTVRLSKRARMAQEHVDAILGPSTPTDPNQPTSTADARLPILAPAELLVDAEMNVLLSPIKIRRLSITRHTTPSSVKQKENIPCTPALASPFRHLSRTAAITDNVDPRSQQSPLLALRRRSSAGISQQNKTSNNFLRRPSGSHLLDRQKRTPSFLISPVSPLRSPVPLQILSPTLSLNSDVLNSSFARGIPQAVSTPLPNRSKPGEIRPELNPTLETPVTPKNLQRLQTSITRSFELLESPTPRPKRHLHVRIPEDSIFTTSLELSVSPTIKQPLQKSTPPRTPPGDSPPEIDTDSDDVLDLLSHMAIDSEAHTVKPVHGKQLTSLTPGKNGRDKSEKKVKTEGHRYTFRLKGRRPIAFRRWLEDAIPYNDEPDELLLTSKGWDWDPFGT